jgi:nitroreductase
MRISLRFAVRCAAVLLVSAVLLCTARYATGPHPTTATAVFAAELKPIVLPAPQTTGGAPLMQALAERKTMRAFADKSLPTQTLSNLLWAAFGVNRGRDVKPGLGRTAPSARNTQDIDLDVVLADGVYIYNAENNTLQPAVAGDLRSAIAPAPAAHAAITIVYVAPIKDDYAQVDTGFIGQNVYLFAASEGLNAWFYASHPADINTKLGLSSDKTVLYLQTVGYPPQ